MTGVNGRFDEIRAEDLLAVANRFSVPGAKQIIKEVQVTIFSRWPKFAAEAGLSGARTKKITDDFRRVQSRAEHVSEIWLLGAFECRFRAPTLKL